MFGQNCDEQVFGGITPERFRALQAQAAASDIPIKGDSGSASAPAGGLGEITVRWDYDRAGQTLTLQCTGKPLLIPCSAVTSQLERLVQAATSIR